MSVRMHHASALVDVRPIKRTDGSDYIGIQQYRGNGRMRSCFKCGHHRSEETGAYLMFFGRKRWVSTQCCAKPAAASSPVNGEARAATNSPGLISQLPDAEKQ